MNNKHDTVDSIKPGGTVQQQQPPPPVVVVSPQASSTIDYKELHVGKLIGSGEFAGKSLFSLQFFIRYFIEDSVLIYFLYIEVYEGTCRKARVAIKILKEPNLAALFLHEADIMR